MAPVYTVEYHHEILSAWGEIRRELTAPPRLITFDFHTDTLPAFNAYSYKRLKLDLGREPQRSEHAALCQQLVDRVDFRDVISVKNAVRELRHDEHIDCARRAGIVSEVAVVLSTDAPGNTPPWAHLFPAPAADAIRTDAVIAANLLDSSSLSLKVRAMREGWNGLGDYIVDIDLDFFRSAATASPRDPAAFRSLLSGARAITIARESRCVIEGRLAGETITADSLFTKLRTMMPG